MQHDSTTDADNVSESYTVKTMDKDGHEGKGDQVGKDDQLGKDGQEPKEGKPKDGEPEKSKSKQSSVCWEAKMECCALTNKEAMGALHSRLRNHV